MSFGLGYTQTRDAEPREWRRMKEGVEGIVARCPSPKLEREFAGDLIVIHPRCRSGCETLVFGRTRAAVNQTMFGDPEGVSFEDADTGEFTKADGNVHYQCKVRRGDAYETVVMDCLFLFKRVLGPAVELDSEDGNMGGGEEGKGDEEKRGAEQPRGVGVYKRKEREETEGCAKPAVKLTKRKTTDELYEEVCGRMNESLTEAVHQADPNTVAPAICIKIMPPGNMEAVMAVTKADGEEQKAPAAKAASTPDDDVAWARAVAGGLLQIISSQDGLSEAAKAQRTSLCCTIRELFANNPDEMKKFAKKQLRCKGNVVLAQGRTHNREAHFVHGDRKGGEIRFEDLDSDGFKVKWQALSSLFYYLIVKFE